MTLFATPGIYQQTLESSSRPGATARGDIAVLLGYTVRGPVGAPVRLQSLSQFEEIFGPALPGGFLWHGVKGFFECGGAAAYAIRIADPSHTTAAASAGLGNGWRAEASFPWAIVDPRRVNREIRADLAVWQACVDAEVRDHGSRRPDPGSWANTLHVEVADSSLALTHVVEVRDDGRTLRLASVAGIERASVLRLSQQDSAPGSGGTASTVAALGDVDLTRRLVRLRRPLQEWVGADHFDPARRIEVASVEFDITIVQAGRVVQTFPRLAPDPRHSRALERVLAADSRHVALLRVPEPGTGMPGDEDWTRSINWPARGSFPLSGGRDALAMVGADDWHAALGRIRRLGDAAMIVAPDLVRGGSEPRQEPETRGAAASCGDIAARAPGYLSLKVVTWDADAKEHRPVEGALVDIAGPGESEPGKERGQFALSGLTLGLIDLRVAKPGFHTLELLAQTSPWPGGQQVEAELVPLVQLPELGDDAILGVQRALGDPQLVGPWKVAFVDLPPTVESAEGWRSRAAELGPEPRLCLLAPWLEVPDPAADGGRLAVPPSGHVAGAFARAEIDDGVYRGGGNLPLRYVCGTTLPIDDEVQAGLNPVGVNAIRAFEGRGVRLYGTRSLAVGTDWQFVTVRRLVDAVEKTLHSSLATLVFEPNSPFLREAARASTESFLTGLWRRGYLAGDSPEAAFQVTCDEGNNPPELAAAGQLLIEVALAPTVPFEFIVFRIGHAFDAVQITEAT